MASTEGYRVEHDSMGEVRVPADAKWGAQTERAVHNFPISGITVEPALIQALAIAAAAADVADGQWGEQFPVDVFQTGSGTSTNMNMNEVLATLASERLAGLPVHPNDHVNAAQSSNDVFPSAVHLACALALRRDLEPALTQLAQSLRARARAWAKVVKAGRTHLMDATPVTLGQEFSG